jgi:hypothetical protein
VAASAATGKISLRTTDIDWINLTQDRVQWQSLVNTAVNPQIPQKENRSLAAVSLSGSQAGICGVV